MIKFLSISISIIILSACSDKYPIAQKETSKEEGVEIDSLKVTTKTKPIDEGTISNYDKDEIIAYNIESMEALEVLNASMNKFTDLLMEVSTDPTLTMNEEWMTNTAFALTVMDQSIDQLRALDTPVLMEESHKYLMMGLDEYDFMIDHFPEAIDNYDLDLINQCAEAMFAGSDYIAEASRLDFEILDSLKENNSNENINVNRKENDINSNINKIVESQQSNQTSEKLYRIQAGVFSSKENALELERDIKSSDIETAIVEKEGYYIVYVGAFKIKENAEKRRAELESHGFKSYMRYE